MLIRPGLGQHAKTDAAQRVVPIHPVLIAAGFMELVEQRRAEGSHWLFPTLDHGHDGRFSSVFTKRFARYREDEGLYDPQRDYHSLRKDFNGSMKRAGVPIAARKALMGHKIVDLTDGVYDPEGDSVAQKLEYIRTIDYGIKVERIDGIPVVKLRETADPSAAMPVEEGVS
jgi:integrase